MDLLELQLYFFPFTKFDCEKACQNKKELSSQLLEGPFLPSVSAMAKYATDRQPTTIYLSAQNMQSVGLWLQVDLLIEAAVTAVTIKEKDCK